MSEGRELGGPHGSGRPPRRGVYLVRRVAVGLALLVLMVLIAPQAYQALVGSNSGTQAPPPEAEDGENLGAGEPVAEPAPPAEAQEERAIEPAPEEPIEKGTAVKPPEDAPKDEKPASEEESAPPEPAEPAAEEAAAAVLDSEQQYSAVAQYPVDAQYAVTEQYLQVDQPLPVLPEIVVPEAVVPEPVDIAVQNAEVPVEYSSAVQAPAPVMAEPLLAEPVAVEPVAFEAQYAPAAAPVAFEAQYAPAAAPVAFEAQYAPAAAPVAFIAPDEFAVPAAAPVVEDPQVYSATVVANAYQVGDGTANAVAYSSAGG